MSELKLQASVWQWFYNEYPKYRVKGKTARCMLIHNYNNPRSKVIGSQLSSAGLTKGMPDMSLLVPSEKYSGLMIELKQPGETPRKDQIEMMEALYLQGYCVCVCSTLESAKSIINDYLSNK